MNKKLLTLICVGLLNLQCLDAWGVRGHTVANLAAVEGIPPDGPVFLKPLEAYIGHLGTIPDTWRGYSEPYLRISEDANHGWYTEQFDFIPNPPHLPSTFAAISPLFSDAAQVKQMLAQDIAFYMGWVGHYVADAAQPLHNSRHHDGWSGPNPKGYTRDPQIHGLFESRYVDLIEVTAPDVVKYMRKDARHPDDVWKATLDHSLEARESVEDVYRADLRGAFRRKDDIEARELVYKRLAAGAGFLRDLAYTAWIESAKPAQSVDPVNRMENPANPKYNPAAGSAPAP